MESELVLGFKEATSSEVFGEGNYMLVPWINWDDWSFVRESLFSSSPESIDLALRRISAWRSRGCLPIIIEVTASIVEIQQKDSHFRDGLFESDLLAEDMLTMLYCMTIMRLVNGIVEKTRKKNEVSIGEAADVIGIPRMLIDIRHECSHRELPSLRLVRLASTKALDWLKAYYWEPQMTAIPCPSAAKEIKSKIRELAFNLDVNQTTSSLIKGKRSKKHKNKALKNLLKLYTSFPSEMVSILLQFLLKAQESADVAHLPNNSQISTSEGDNSITKLDDWKPLIMKLSNKEPNLLLSLLKALVQVIQARQPLKHESGVENLTSDHNPGFQKIEHLSYLFKWLVLNLKDLKPSTETISSPKEKSLPKSTLIHLLRQCLTVSSLGNTDLAMAASILAQTTGNHNLVHKVNKLASLHKPNTDAINEINPIDPENFYNQQEKFINQVAKKLEFFKRKLSEKSNLKSSIVENKKRWNVVKSWKPCPIGMLPCDIDSSGVFPVLDDKKEEKGENLEDCNEKCEVNESRGKREADILLGVLDDLNVKRRKENECVVDEDKVVEDVKNNRLMIGGVWKRLTEDEVISIASSVRIFV